MPLDRNIKFVSPNEVKYQIKQLKSRKAPGMDNISNRALKLLPLPGIIHITCIYNSIIRYGYFPHQWKMASIIMIPKPNKPPEEVSSYRPISLLSAVSKIFERILLARMYRYVVEKIPLHQFGFRQEHSTPQQCHRIVEYIKHAFERKEYCPAIFLDITQAFDKVWHTGLLYKLKNILPYYLYTLMKSYLQERQFRVRVGKTFSDIGSVGSGVPQGSALGPLLYTIYTHDMPVIINGITATFADDTAFMVSNSDKNEASRLLQIHMNHFAEWCKKWNIQINAQKSQFITFSWRKGDCPPITINGEEVRECVSASGPPKVKYLGIILDRRLTFGPHIKQKRKELNARRKSLYYILNKNSPLSLENKLLLYKTILKPIWTYCCPIWGLASHSNIEVIERFQTISIRVCTGDPTYVPNHEILRDLRIPTVKEEITRLAAIHSEKMVNHSNNLATCCISNCIRLSRLKGG
jgi:hypothetical protein